MDPLIDAFKGFFHGSLAGPQTPMAILAAFVAISMFAINILRPHLIFTPFPIVNGTSPLKGKRLEDFYQNSKSLFQKGWKVCLTNIITFTPYK